MILSFAMKKSFAPAHPIGKIRRKTKSSSKKSCFFLKWRIFSRFRINRKLGNDIAVNFQTGKIKMKLFGKHALHE
ncbi:hypothetical protein SAMN05421827_11093 [Pedobacter terrae]|uniref:Uncharacterized protein n=1 Tax=Pedobacter terrae TaxID=405671 RepID=A0A1G7WPY3_9SPHI|nr:hypothetical protein SAMN05421827_11093 [Pedobacter terrae]